DFAIFSAGCVTVPVYPTYPPDLIAYVVNDSEAKTLIVEDPAQLAKALQVRDKTPGLEQIVVITGYDAPQPPKMVMTWQSLTRLGRESEAAHKSTLAERVTTARPEDLATIVYTSGTTGPPKGVLQTHGNHIAAVDASRQSTPVEEGWVHLLFLPLAHSFARLESFLGVPSGLELRRKLADKLVFSKLHAALGGRLQWAVSGGAPLSRDIAEFFHAAGILLLEGYGLTETCPALTFNRRTSFKFGSVGQPLPGVELKIAPDGEILARGPNIATRGYFKQPEATKEVFEPNGWFHTGDIGVLDSDGFLFI